MDVEQRVTLETLTNARAKLVDTHAPKYLVQAVEAKLADFLGVPQTHQSRPKVKRRPFRPGM